jgi:hypothetical protein
MRGVSARPSHASRDSVSGSDEDLGCCGVPGVLCMRVGRMVSHGKNARQYTAGVEQRVAEVRVRGAKWLRLALVAVMMRVSMGAQTPVQESKPDENGIYKVGGDVKAPRVIYSEEPKFPEGTPGQDIAGCWEVALIVGADGAPQDVRRMDSGVKHKAALDVKVVEAVRQYKFKPAIRNGVAVPVRMFLGICINPT